MRPSIAYLLLFETFLVASVSAQCSWGQYDDERKDAGNAPTCPACDNGGSTNYICASNVQNALFRPNCYFLFYFIYVFLRYLVLYTCKTKKNIYDSCILNDMVYRYPNVIVMCSSFKRHFPGASSFEF